jgi:hypothetical protein
MKTVAALHASQLVTVAGPDLGIIRDGRIDSAGVSNEIEKKDDYSWHSLIGRCPGEC